RVPRLRASRLAPRRRRPPACPRSESEHRLGSERPPRGHGGHGRGVVRRPGARDPVRGVASPARSVMSEEADNAEAEEADSGPHMGIAGFVRAVLPYFKPFKAAAAVIIVCMLIDLASNTLVPI